MESSVILCGANAYKQKYYFNDRFSKLPKFVKEELNILCVHFTEEVGGVFMIGFDEDGSVLLITDADEDDILYDEIGAGLLVKEERKRRQELFESLEMFYKSFIMGGDRNVTGT